MFFLLHLFRAPAGYCFVEFSSTQQADNALNKLNGLSVPGTNPVSSFYSFFTSLVWETLGHTDLASCL